MKGPDAQVPSKPAPAAAQITRQGLNVSLKQILAFLSVAQTENFTTSATALCTTQSAVSNLIKELERELDLQLFARTTRSVRLTDAGREFLDSAERVYAELQSAVSKAKTLSKQRHGQVRVAASPLMASLVLPEAIAKFHATHPNISVVLRDAPYDQVRRLVIDGAAEIGFGLMPDADQGLNGELLSSGALSLIFPSGHPLEKVKTLTWQEVATYPFIALTSENGTRQTAEQCATECGVVLQPAYEVSFIWTAISMVEAGFGVCVVPCYVRALRGMNVCKIQAGETKASIALISRSEVPLSPAAKSFRDFIWDYID